MENYYIMMALKEAKKAYKKNDVPVGAIIVKNNKIIARAYNRKEKTKIATHHAEILAIEKACKKLNDWRLNDCEMYVSLEPCLMCKGAIMESRIKKAIYCVKCQKEACNSVKKEKTTEFIYKKINNDAEKLLKTFFENKR
ncbi:MAG: nucleoside deaminase [Bacilli bacterium]